MQETRTFRLRFTKDELLNALKRTFHSDMAIQSVPITADIAIHPNTGSLEVSWTRTITSPGTEVVPYRIGQSA